MKLPRLLAVWFLALGTSFLITPFAQADGVWQASNANVSGNSVQFDFRGGSATYTTSVPDSSTVTVTVNNTIANCIGNCTPIADTWNVSINGQSFSGNVIEVSTISVQASGQVTISASGIDRGFWAGWYGPIISVSFLAPVPAPVATPDPTPPAPEPSPTSSPDPQPTEQPQPEPSSQPLPTPSPSVDTNTSTPVQPAPQPNPEPSPTPEPIREPEPPTAEQIAAAQAAAQAAEELRIAQEKAAEEARIAEEKAKAEEQVKLEAEIKAALEEAASESGDIPVLVVAEPEIVLPVTPVDPVEPEPQPEEPEPLPVTPEPVPVPEPIPSPEPVPVSPPVTEPVEIPVSVPVTPEPIALTEDLNLEELPADFPILLENGVVLTAEVVIAIQLLENPAELLSTMFTDPAQALTALSNIGADMSPEVREDAEKVVVSAIIAGGIATQAAAGAAATAAYRRKP